MATTPDSHAGGLGFKSRCRPTKVWSPNTPIPYLQISQMHEGSLLPERGYVGWCTPKAEHTGWRKKHIFKIISNSLHSGQSVVCGDAVWRSEARKKAPHKTVISPNSFSRISFFVGKRILKMQLIDYGTFFSFAISQRWWGHVISGGIKCVSDKGCSALTERGEIINWTRC